MFYNGSPYVFEELLIDDDGMNCKLNTGNRYTCELGPDGSGGYQGKCLYQKDAEERNNLISLAPPEGMPMLAQEVYNVNEPNTRIIR